MFHHKNILYNLELQLALQLVSMSDLLCSSNCQGLFTPSAQKEFCSFLLAIFRQLCLKMGPRPIPSANASVNAYAATNAQCE